MDHVEQILSAIGVRAVHAEYYSWRWDSEERKKIAGRISSFRKNTGTKYVMNSKAFLGLGRHQGQDFRQGLPALRQRCRSPICRRHS